MRASERRKACAVTVTQAFSAPSLRPQRERCLRANGAIDSVAREAGGGDAIRHALFYARQMVAAARAHRYECLRRQACWRDDAATRYRP